MAYADYTDEDIKEAVINSRSIAGCLRQLGKRPAGGNYSNLKKHLQRLNLDTDHWTGQAWNKGEQLKDWSQYTNAVRCKKHLIKKRGHRCECCNMDEWMEDQIPLELHHIDGNRTNNEYENLQLICPNCHALTDNWKNKKRGS